jgi:hypothetical protein
MILGNQQSYETTLKMISDFGFQLNSKFLNQDISCQRS